MEFNEIICPYKAMEIFLMTVCVHFAKYNKRKTERGCKKWEKNQKIKQKESCPYIQD